MTVEDILEKLTDEERRLLFHEFRRKPQVGETIKVGDGAVTLAASVKPKGAIKISGITRRSMSLTVTQCLRLIEAAPALRDFLTRNAERLKT